MNIRSVRVQNFRSIRDETLDCSLLTALVGPNGSGKSAFLKAIDLLYSTSDRISLSDFYNEDPAGDIVITVTFDDLGEEAKRLFESRVEDGTLTVEKVFSWRDGNPQASYHGSTLQNPDFDPIRAGIGLRDRGATARGALEELRASEEYDALPEWTTIQETLDRLKGWEAAHPERCARRRDDGQFFGFRQVGQGYLGRFTRCLFVPAVRDASADAVEGRGSIFTDLIDLAVRSALANKPEVQGIKERIQAEYTQILSPEKLPELGNLAGQLSTTLQTFVSNAQILLNWLPLDELDVPMPKADMKIVEDGYPAPLDKCGHDLQRAFVVTILQHLTMARLSPGGEEKQEEEEGAEQGGLPNLVLLIEEPELYQHPTRQRHFARILWELSQSATAGVADQTQVIYSTHSPHFVGLDRIESIRLLRKAEVPEGLPRETKVVHTSLDYVAEQIWNAAGQPGARFTRESLAPRLTSIMTASMSEGFFAEVAVLVEGEDDRAAIVGMADVIQIDLDSMGVAVIPCGGKTNIDRPAAIFRSLGIPVYAIWDADQSEETSNPAHNRHLLRLFGQEPEDWPTGVYEEYACFQENLEVTMREEIGAEVYDMLIAECQEQFGIPRKQDAIKNPSVVAEVISRAADQGNRCESLEGVVRSIAALDERRG